MIARDKQTRQALSRARWSIVQTGLITSGIALFGVYVMGCRDDKFIIMNWTLRRWIAIGPLIVGAVCASGYLIGAYWTGLRIGGWLWATVLLLQVMAFATAHYAEYATLDPVWRDTREPVPFTTYANYVARASGSDYRHAPLSPPAAYAVAGMGLIEFSLGTLVSSLLLTRTPRCPVCGGRLHVQAVGSIDSAADVPRLAHFAALSDPEPLRQFLRTGSPLSTDSLPITLTRCIVCQQGQLIPDTRVASPIDVSRVLAQSLWMPRPNR